MEYIVGSNEWSDKLENLIKDGTVSKDAGTYIDFSNYRQDYKAVINVLTKNKVNINFRKEEETC